MLLCTVCTQQKNTFCQFRLPSNHQICDLGSSSYQAWCAKSETTQFFGNQSYMMKVCPHIRIGICLSEILCAYADIWANFGLIWPIPKKSGSFGLGTSCLITWDSQVTCLIKYSQSLPTYPHRVSENHLLWICPILASYSLSLQNMPKLLKKEKRMFLSPYNDNVDLILYDFFKRMKLVFTMKTANLEHQVQLRKILKIKTDYGKSAWKW